MDAGIFIIHNSCYCNLLFLRFSAISVVSLKNFVLSVLSVGNKKNPLAKIYRRNNGKN